MSRNFGVNHHLYERRFSAQKQKIWLRQAKAAFCIVLTFAIAVTVIVLAYALAFARDDGRYADSPLKPWFNQLASKRGLCCSFADGVKVENVDWDTLDGHFRVRLDGHWIVVPDDAVITEPNRFGPAVVWPYPDAAGTTQIRCFLPGAGA